MGRASKDKRDIYYRKAKEEGYRARSAYKLLQIHEEFNILDPLEIRTGAVDLCAAPGSWSQVLAHHFQQLSTAAPPPAATSGPSVSVSYTVPRVVAVDLQEMAPIDGVTILQGDITSEATANEIIRLLNAPEESSSSSSNSNQTTTHTTTSHPSSTKDESSQMASTAAAAAAGGAVHEGGVVGAASASPRKADIVICDGAPDVTGMHELDEYLQHHLLLAALHITTFILRPGGCFVTKMFRGPNTPFLVAKSEVFFRQVRVVKPKSSRNASMESFLLCQGFRLPPGYVPRFVDAAATDSGRAPPPAASSSSVASAGECPDKKITAEKLEEEERTAGRDASAAGLSGGPLRASNFTPEAPVYTYATTATATATAAIATSSSSGALSISKEKEGEGEEESIRQGCVLPNAVLAPFLSCGDLSGFDADMCYDRAADAVVLQPVQPPLQAPYLAATAGGSCEDGGSQGEATAKNKRAKVDAGV